MTTVATQALTQSAHPVARGHKSFPPPAWSHAARKARRILRPYGRNTLPAFTLDTFTTPTPAMTGWRLFAHLEDDTRVLLFERADLPAMPDPDDEVRAALDWACIQPGDEGDSRIADFTSAQLDWSMRHAANLRREARERLGWGSEALRPLRADIDGIMYQVRRTMQAGSARHRATVGIVEVTAPTRRACKEGVVHAVRNQLSAFPFLQWGQRTGAAYLLFPQGAQWCVQRAAPGFEAETVGVFSDMDAAKARDAFAGMLARVEGRSSSQVRMKAVALPTAWRRPTARAGREVHG